LTNQKNDNRHGGAAMPGNQNNERDIDGTESGQQAATYAPDDGPLSPDELMRIRIEAESRRPKGCQLSTKEMLPHGRAQPIPENPGQSD
jgi:hypothetical protein